MGYDTPKSKTTTHDQWSQTRNHPQDDRISPSSPRSPPVPENACEQSPIDTQTLPLLSRLPIAQSMHQHPWLAKPIIKNGSTIKA